MKLDGQNHVLTMTFFDANDFILNNPIFVKNNMIPSLVLNVYRVNINDLSHLIIFQ